MMNSVPEHSVARAKLLIGQQETLSQAREYLRGLRQRIADQERQYGYRSEDVAGAIGREELEETLEICDWMIDFDTLRRMTVE